MWPSSESVMTQGLFFFFSFLLTQYFDLGLSDN